jgi:hypothetical protein
MIGFLAWTDRLTDSSSALDETSTALTPPVFSFLGRERPRPLVSSRFPYFVRRIHGKQHEVIETVAAIVVMLAQL